MRKLLIYTAGAMEVYAGTDKAEGWRNEVKKYFDRCSDNICVVNPTSYYAYGENYHKSESEVFRFDLYKVRKSDVMLVNLNDIRKSIGSSIEVYEAYRNDIPVIGFLDTELSVEETIKLIHPWVYCCVNRIETGEQSMYRAMEYIKNYYS